MNNKKTELLVAALENGTVIDHIPSELVFTIAQLLELEKLSSSVTIGYNLNSKKIGKKGVIKVADKFFSANRVLAFLNIVGAILLFWLTKIETFSLFFPVLLLYSICFMPTMSLTNSISFANLTDAGKEFSRIRLFGSFGWIGSGLLISALGLEIYSTPFPKL